MDFYVKYIILFKIINLCRRSCFWTTISDLLYVLLSKKQHLFTPWLWNFPSWQNLHWSRSVVFNLFPNAAFPIAIRIPTPFGFCGILSRMLNRAQVWLRKNLDRVPQFWDQIKNPVNSCPNRSCWTKRWKKHVIIRCYVERHVN